MKHAGVKAQRQNLSRPQADPTLLPVMRRGMDRLAIRGADTRLAKLLEGWAG